MSGPESGPDGKVTHPRDPTSTNQKTMPNSLRYAKIRISSIPRRATSAGEKDSAVTPHPLFQQRPRLIKLLIAQGRRQLLLHSPTMCQTPSANTAQRNSTATPIGPLIAFRNMDISATRTTNGANRQNPGQHTVAILASVKLPLKIMHIAGKPGIRPDTSRQWAKVLQQQRTIKARKTHYGRFTE